MHNTGPYHNSPILNEIHTYFPALLYDNNFQTVPDVFSYIRHQMRARFDVYSTQREERRPQRQRGSPWPPRNSRPQRRPPPPVTPVVQTYVAHPQPLSAADIGAMYDFNTILYRALGVPVPGNFSDPVPVRPTRAQIDAGSTLHTNLHESEAPCSVCQDAIRAGETSRRLNHCSHTFHQNCIDTWYQRNVHCPVCRHDIRTL